VLALASCRADNSDRPAAGVFVSKHLGIELALPDNWMSRAAGDRTIERPDGRERGAELYTGDAADPTTAMSVRLTDPSPGAPSFALMSEEVMLESARGGAAGSRDPAAVKSPRARWSRWWPTKSDDTWRRAISAGWGRRPWESSLRIGVSSHQLLVFIEFYLS
jgi:hypothetical protein